MKGKIAKFNVHRKLNLLAALQVMLVMLWLPSAALCSSVTLAWDPSTDADLAGYKVYYQANSSVQPFSGTGASEGSAPLDVASSNSATVSGLDPNNAYYFAVTAYNSSGAESLYSNVVEVKELVVPVVAITSPANNSSVSGTVSVAATATDNKGVVGVEFYLNGVLQSTDTAAPYAFSWNTSSLASGQYTITTKAYDAAGNVGSSEIVASVSGDTAAPSVVISAPGNNAQVSGNVAITASATDNVGVTRMELYDNANLIFAGNQNTVSYTWNSAAAGSGSHVLTVQGYDAAGNAGSAKVTVNVVNVVTDATAPTVAIASPTNGSTVSGTVAVSATASDNVAVSKVEFYVNGALKSTSTSAPYGFSWSTTVLANGTYGLVAKAYDAAGNVGQSASVSVNVFNDKTAPVVSISSPANGSTVSGTVAVYATASDNVAVKKVEFYMNGTLKATATSAPYGFSWSTTALANGTYGLVAKAYDAAGNVGQSASVSVNVFNDKTVPVVSISSPINSSKVSGTVSVYATASDNVAVKKVEFYVNGTLKATATSAPYGFSWNTTALANGTYGLVAKAYDAAGNVGQSASVSVTVYNDKTAPVVSISSPTNSSKVSGTVAVKATASDNVAVKKVEFYVNGTLKATYTAAPYTFSWNTTALANGTYGLVAKAYDAAGNVGQSATVSVNVYNDKTAPTITLLSPTGSYVYSSQVKISASATDNIAVTKMQLYLDGTLLVTTTSSSFSMTPYVAKGQHTIVIKAYDAANNVQSLSKTFTR